MKRIAAIIIVIVIVIAAGSAKYKFTSNKYKDINYAAQRYITTGLLNKYKLNKINDMTVSFSDGTIAVMSVAGLQSKAPHRTANYKIFLVKAKNGVWRVKNIYPE